MGGCFAVVNLGAVTPGMIGKFDGGVLDWGE